MGFRFMAIASDKKYEKDNIEELCFQFWLKKLTFEKEVLFEKAVKINFADPGYLDILFLETGTIIFTSDPEITNLANVRRNSFEGKAGFFVADEISMTFRTEYYENYWLRKLLLENNGTIHMNTHSIGNELVIDFTDGFDLVIQLISSIIGMPFFNIPPEQTCYRYRMTNESIDHSKIGLYKKLWYGKLSSYIAEKKKEVKDKEDNAGT